MRHRTFVGPLSVAVIAAAALAVPAEAQRGQSGPAEHAEVEPINDRPNPYRTIRDFGVLPNGRNWGSVSAINVDIDGRHIWVGDRCGVNSCAESGVHPIVKLDPDGNTVAAFGAGLITWPHGMDVDSEGNIWAAFCLSKSYESLEKFRGWALKITPDGEAIPVASGIRSPCGVGTNSVGVMFYSESQGQRILFVWFVY